MKTTFFKFLLFGLFLAIFTSCETEDSESVDQDRIFAVYDLFYNTDTDQTAAIATFTFGNRTGTRIQLSNGASVSFDGSGMGYNATLGVYTVELAGYEASGTFVYEDLDGNVFTNSVTLNPIDFTDNIQTTLDRNESYTVAWQGEAVDSQGGYVAVTVVPNNIAQTKIFTQGNVGSDTVVLTTSELSGIDPQPATLVMERLTAGELSEGTSAGGVTLGRYRPASVAVTVE